MRVHC
ncbi:hypothetical protein D039_0053A, partial [Vibrio parahaemolyticus EKP-028]